MTTAALHRLWVARPRLFNNPIILRELFTQLRKKQSFLFLLLFIAVAVHALVSNWHVLVETRNSALVFSQLSFNIALFLAIVTPLLSATAVNTEYQSDTWDLLLTTHISLPSILFGKLFSSMVFVYFLFLSIIPIFSLMMPLGGVSPTEIYFLILAGTHVMLVSSLVGLYCSIRFKRPVQSIFVSYVICFCLFFVVPYFGGSIFSPFLLTGNNRILRTMPGLIQLPFFGTMTLAKFLLFQLMVLTFEATVLLTLCVWHINVLFKERCQRFFDRVLISISAGLERLDVLLILILLLALGCWLYSYSIHYLRDLIFKNSRGNVDQVPLFSAGTLAIILKFFVLFPAGLQMAIQLTVQWNLNRWGEVDTTPQNLRRMLFRHVYASLLTGGFYLAAFSPVLLATLFTGQYTLFQFFWLIFGFLDALLLMSISVLLVSINKKFVCQTLLWSMWVFLVIAFFVPAGLSVLLREIFYSPQFVLSAYFQRGYMWNPSYGIGFYFSYFSFYYIYLIIIFVAIILAAQRRVLQRAGIFKEETLQQWFKRTVLNMLPQRGKTPPRPMPPLPDDINPLLFKELRENLIGPGARMDILKWTIGLFCLSVLMLMIKDMMFQRFNIIPDNPYPLLICVFPLMIVPFAANAFRREKDQNTWEILLTTTLSPSSLLNAKFITGLALCAIYTVALFLPMLLRDGKANNLPFFTNMFVLLAVLVPLILSFSLFFSLHLPKTVTAYVVSLLTAYLFLLNPLGIPSPASLIGKYIYLRREQFFTLTYDLRRIAFDSVVINWKYDRNSVLLVYILLALFFYYLSYRRLQTYMYRGK